jgi:hypothetical protein
LKVFVSYTYLYVDGDLCVEKDDSIIIDVLGTNALDSIDNLRYFLSKETGRNIRNIKAITNVPMEGLTY